MTTTANKDDDHCDCEVHGHQPITFVCTHIVGRTSPDTAGFVSFPPEGWRWSQGCMVWGLRRLPAKQRGRVDRRHRGGSWRHHDHMCRVLSPARSWCPL